MPIIARGPGRIAIAGYFSILQKALGIGKQKLYSIPVQECIEIGISERKDRDINVALVDYGKNNVGTWNRYINFSNPPSFADEELFSPVFCAVETVFNYMEAKNIKFSGVNVSVKKSGILGEPFGTQCLASDHAVVATTIHSLVEHYNLKENNLTESLIHEADKYFSNDKFVNIDSEIYVKKKKHKNTHNIIESISFFSTGLGSYRNVLLENLLEAFKVNDKLIKLIQKGIQMDNHFEKHLKNEANFKRFMKDYEIVLEELKSLLNINLGYKLERELQNLRNYAYVIPIELHYSAHYMAIPKTKRDSKEIKSYITNNNWELRELKEGNYGITIKSFY
ncbi:MAG: hypothetical protein N3E37_00640 [Candidatus Micrarchaeota archaeon]|nr:hypothetical protein [Candidatus Micrarchaeota archaeon]